MVLETDGAFTVYVGSSAVGQGLETVFAQIAADALEMPMERIRGVFHGSTSLRERRLRRLSFALDRDGRLGHPGGGGEAARGDPRPRRGSASAARRPRSRSSTARRAGPGGKSIALAGLADAAISVEGAFLNKKHTYTYGAHAAHVAVDPKLGHVELIDYVAVEDCGRIINPMTLRGQVIGSVVQGLGGAFMEHLVYDEQGQFLTGSLADYLLPTASDFPNIRAVVLEDPSLADQSARRQGRRRRRHHPGRRRDRQCGRQCARARSASSCASCR